MSAEPHEALKINISDDAALLRPITHTGPRFYVAAAILLGITGLGVYAYLQQYSRGLGVTGLNRPVFWGFYITNFVFFIGISHAGTLISAILRIVNAEWRRTITRSAEVITVMVLLFGVGNILIDLGRPDRMLNVVKHGQLRSPLLWEHSAGMEKAMKQRGMEWPELGDDDLLNIIAYVRSASASGAKTYLKPGSPARGQGLFAERKCTECHVSGGGPKEKGPDLSRIELPRSLSALAGRMWNHLPQMRQAAAEQKLDAVSLTAQDMADIIAYLFAKQYEGEPGDPARGRDVFSDKRCVDCHLLAAADEGDERSSAVGMGHAIWQHGAMMADEMAQAAIPWPTFEGTEMADLIVYIKSIGKLIVKEEVALRGKSESAKRKSEK